MNLPTSISKIPYYKISSKYSYEGELVITQGVLYFFPFVDLQDKRQEKSVGLLLGGCVFGPLIYLLSLLLLLPFKFMGNFFKQLPLSSSKVRKQGLWVEGDSSESLQRKLDKHIEQIKEKKLLSSSSLPVPGRFNNDEIFNLKVSPMGNLSLNTRHDKHDFKIGTLRKAAVIEALKIAGFSIQ
jgi:hypothetical protein